MEEGELRRALRGEGGLRWNDVPLSALDFHCSNVLDAVMRQGGLLQSLSKIEGVNVNNANDLQQLAQEAMWFCSSGLNTKDDWKNGRAIDAARRGGGGGGGGAASSGSSTAASEPSHAASLARRAERAAMAAQACLLYTSPSPRDRG